MSITGEPGRGPMRVGIPIADLSAGLFCALGILVALLEREQSGKGQGVATSLLQAQIFMLDFQASRWLNDRRGAGPGRQQPSDQHPDRRVQDHATATSTSPPPAATMWQRLCRAIGAEALLDHPDYATAAARSKNRDALNAAIDALSRRSHQRRMGRAPERGRRAVRPDLRHRRGVRRSAGRAPRHRAGRSRRADARGTLHVVGQPVSLARTPSRLVGRAARARRAHRGGAARVRLQRRRDRQLRKAKVI